MLRSIFQRWRDYQFKKLIQAKAGIPSPIKKIVITPCWYNKKCALVINKSGNYYGLWVVIYEPPYQQIPSILKASKLAEYESWEEAKRKICFAHCKLDGDNPILAFYSRLPLDKERISRYPWEIIVKFHLPAGGLKEPDQHIKPLDIIAIDRNEYYHLAVYLGKGKVCHIWDPDEKENSVARIDEWKNFLSANRGEIVGYHSLIPFKRRSLIIEQLAKAVVNQHGQGEYSLLFNSCEHFAHTIIYGLNFSDQTRRNLATFWYIISSFSLGQTIIKIKEKVKAVTKKVETVEYFDLEKEIEKNNKVFTKMKLDEEVKAKIKEIRGLMNLK